MSLDLISRPNLALVSPALQLVSHLNPLPSAPTTASSLLPVQSHSPTRDADPPPVVAARVLWRVTTTIRFLLLITRCVERRLCLSDSFFVVLVMHCWLVPIT